MRATPAKPASNVKGGQIRTSQPGSPTPCISASSSASDVTVPFIFQFPAASLRLVMVVLSDQREGVAGLARKKTVTALSTPRIRMAARILKKISARKWRVSKMIRVSVSGVTETL